MAAVTVYFLNTAATTPNWFGKVQDDGSAPAGALSAFGWTTAKVAVTTPYWRGRIGATARATVAQASSWIDNQTSPTQGTGSGATTAGDSFRSDNPLTGVWAAGNWNFTFGMRTGAATHSGRVRLRMWASSNASGAGARALTSTTLVGSTVTMNSATTTFNSTVTWAAPEILLNNEYVFTQVEWQTTTAGTSNSCTAQFYQASFITTNWTVIVPTADAWNAADKANVTLSNSDKKATATAASAGVRSTQVRTNNGTGKYYFEFVFDNIVNPSGIAVGLNNITVFPPNAGSGYTLGIYGHGLVQFNAQTASFNFGNWANGDVVGVAWDAVNEQLYIRKNGGLWNLNASADPETGTGGYAADATAGLVYGLWLSSANSGDAVTVRTELAELSYKSGMPSFTSWMGEAMPADTGERYWRGGTANWDATAGSKWSDTVGGAAGASVPNATHDVFFDATSSGTVTVASSSTLKSIDFTGFTGTLTGSAIQTLSIAGNITLSSGMTMVGGGPSWSFSGIGAKTITSNGKVFGGGVTFNVGAAYLLADDFASSGQVTISSGTPFNANNKSVTASGFSFTGNPEVFMGGGVWTATSSGSAWSVTGGSVSLDHGSGTIRFTNNGPSAKSFIGGSLDYYNFDNATGGTGSLTISGSNTFAIFDIAATGAADGRNVQFTAGSTHILNELKQSVGTGHVLTSTAAAQFFLTDFDGGENVLAQTTVSWSNASEAVFKYGTDGGNNTGWESNVVLPAEGTGTLAAQGATTVGPGKSESVVTGALVAVPYVSSNLFPASEAFDNAGWTKTGSTVSPNQIVAPDSALTADQIIETTSTGGHFASMSRATTVGQPYTFSIYAKAGTRSIVRLSMSGTSSRANFNLAAGTIGLAAGFISQTITAVGNGWYRCSVTNNATAASSTFYAYLMPSDGVNPDYTGDGSSSAYLWGAQLEQASVATAYAPSVGVMGTGTVQWNATGALVAGSRTNLIRYSQEFDSVGVWTVSAASVVANGITAPDGTLTADRLIDYSSSSYHYVYQQNFAIAADRAHTISVYAKADTLHWVQLYLTSTIAVIANFDLAGVGAVGSVSGGGATAKIENVGNGWFRCSVTFLSTAAGGGTWYIILSDRNSATNPVYVGDGNGAIYFWGAQVEASGIPTAYIQTIGSPVTVGTPPLLTGTGVVYTPAVGTGALVAGTPRTNLLTRSQEFEHAQWSKANATVLANAAYASDGSLTAEQITDDTANGHHFVGQSCFVGSGNQATYSVYAKAETLTWLQLYNSSSSSGVNFNLATGVVGLTSGSGFTYNIEDAGGGWWRCSITFNANVGSPLLYCILKNANTAGLVAYVGTGQSLFLWGAQLETAPAPTAYIQTGVSYATVYDGASIASVGTVTLPTIDGTGVLTSTVADLDALGDTRSTGTAALVAVPNVRANLVHYSEEFESGKWSIQSSNTTQNDILAPDSTLTAERFTDVVGLTAHYLYQSVILVGGTFTWSVYAKAGTLSWLRLQVFGSGTDHWANFNIATGAIGLSGFTPAGGVPTITAVGDGWHRCSIAMPSSGSNPQVYCMLMDGDNPSYSYNGSGTGSVYLWGAQFAPGMAPGDYVKTISSTVSAPDVLTGTGIAQHAATGALVAGTTRTNQIKHSQQFVAVGIWNAQNASVTQNVIAAPDSTITADRLNDAAVNSVHDVYQSSIPLIAGGIVTASIYAKAGTLPWLQLFITNATFCWANFNLLTGAIGQRSNCIPKIEALADGWYRCSIAATPPCDNTTGQFICYLQSSDASGNTGYLGDGTGNIHIWGAQFESGNSATAYIPTGVTPVTAENNAPLLTGAGQAFWLPATGTGVLTSTVADLDALGDSRSFGTSALTAVAKSHLVNMLTQSENIAVSPWTYTGSTFTADQINAPNGQLTADLFRDQGTTNQGHAIFQSVSGLVLPSSPYTFSIHLKRSTCDWVRVRSQLNNNPHEANFDLANGVVGFVAAATTANIQSLGDGWYRCSISFTSDIATGGTSAVYLMPHGDVAESTYPGTSGATSVYLWGAQLEPGLVVSTYVPTTTAAAYQGETLVGTGTAAWNVTGALAAGARTNLARDSETFNNWTTTSATVTVNATNAPNNTLTAERFNDDAASSVHAVHLSGIPNTTGQTYTGSVYLKAGTTSWIQLISVSGSVLWANFNLSTGQLGQKHAAATAAIEALPNDWYRCSITTVAGGVSTQFLVYLLQGDVGFNTPYVGGSGNIFAWGAQFEQGTKATTYIPTTTAPVTVGTPPLLTGAGQTRWVATGALTSTAAVASVGLSSSTGAGSVAAQPTAIAGVDATFGIVKITVAAPSIGVGTFAQIYPLATAALAVTSPTIGVGLYIRNISAVPLIVVSPTIGAPVLAKTLTATNLAVPVPVFGVTPLGKLLSAANLATGPPTVETETLVQKHILGVVALAVGSPTHSAAVIGQMGVLGAMPIAVGLPAIGVGIFAQRHVLAPVALPVTSPAIGQGIYGRVIPAIALAVPAPTIGVSTLTKTLTAANFSTTVLTIGTPALTKRIAPANLAAPVPAIGAGLLGQKHIFTGTALTVAPAIGVGVLSQLSHLSATSIAIAVPTIGVTTFGQKHLLTPQGVTAVSPASGEPSLGKVLSATALVVGTPVIAAPQLAVVLAAALPFATGAPVFGTPVCKPQIPLTTAGNVSQAPTIGAPLIKQRHVFAAVPLVVAPVLPVLSLGLAAVPTKSGAPVVGSASLTQRHVLVAAGAASGLPVHSPTFLTLHVHATAPDLVAGTPVIAQATLKQRHVLDAADAAAGAPDIDSAAFNRRIAVVAVVAVVAAPVLAKPTLEPNIDDLLAADASAGAPAIEAPALGQRHVLDAPDLVRAPVISVAFLGQTGVMAAVPLWVGSPSSDLAELHQRQRLTAYGAIAGGPALGMPSSGMTVALPRAQSTYAGRFKGATPAIGQGHRLISPAVTVGAPRASPTTLVAGSVLGTGDLATGAPVLGAPVMGVIVKCVPMGMRFGYPVLGAGQITSQVHAIRSENLTGASPQLQRPRLSEARDLDPSGIVAGPPSFGAPDLAQRVRLISVTEITGRRRPTIIAGQRDSRVDIIGRSKRRVNL